MSGMVGYGEDPLTLWAVTSQLGGLLEQLDDTSPAEEAQIFYRPSFGRRGKAKDLIRRIASELNVPLGGTCRAEFGEFDSILSTNLAVYLIEAKWDRSPECRDGRISLRDEQTLRHTIFRWYREKWEQREGEPGWSSFVDRHDAEFRHRFPGNKMAPPKSLLAGNLAFVLGRLAGYGRRIEDVLLYLHRDDGRETFAILPPPGFKLIQLAYRPLADTGFITLAPGLTMR